MYHGAEHKVIHAYEEGKDLTLENVRVNSPLHPRCGTAFLLTVVVISIFLFAPLNVLFPYGLGLILRIALLPVVAMLAYEYIRFSARHLDNPIIHAITVPNLAMQKLTTREPDDTMVQVAIEALKKVLDAEQNRPLNPEYGLTFKVLILTEAPRRRTDSRDSCLHGFFQAQASG
jgi:uncharacterized protein YqhQ